MCTHAHTLAHTHTHTHAHSQTHTHTLTNTHTHTLTHTHSHTHTHTLTAYTICKHFLIDASSGLYHFVGPQQRQFNRLPDLLKFYRYVTFPDSRTMVLTWAHGR